MPAWLVNHQRGESAPGIHQQPQFATLADGPQRQGALGSSADLFGSGSSQISVQTSQQQAFIRLLFLNIEKNRRVVFIPIRLQQQKQQDATTATIRVAATVATATTY